MLSEASSARSGASHDEESSTGESSRPHGAHSEEPDEHDDDDSSSSHLHQDPFASRTARSREEPLLLPNARDHTYLPGVSYTFQGEASRGLVQEDVITTAAAAASTTTTSSTHRPTTTGQAPQSPHHLLVWQTPGDLVVLPGVTLPLRLESDPTRPLHQAALRRLQEQIAKSRNAPASCPTVTLGIWSRPLASREERRQGGRRRRRVSSSSSSESSGGGGQDEEESAEEEHAPEPWQRRRQSWTRLGMGPSRLRRASRRLREEMGEVDWAAIQEAVASGNEEQGPASVHAVEVTVNDRTDDVPLPGAIQRNTGHNEGLSMMHDGEAASSLPRPSSRRHRRPPPDPWHGQIGTLVTVAYAHERDSYPATSTPASLRQLREDDLSIILTVRAVGRFLVAQHPENESLLRADPYAHARRNRHAGHLCQLWVHEWPEQPPPRLPVTTDLRRRVASPATSLPAHVQDVWNPYNLMHELRHALASLPSLAALVLQAPKDPISFSYKLACNLPSLSARQKLRILQMPTAAERLAFLRRVFDTTAHADLCCGQCSFPLASTGQVFALPGASGTAGAYVNPHGVVHETLTFRELDLLEDPETDLWLLGGPCLRDSWFPGYAWTILNCALCGSHLGWKFTIAKATAGASTSPPNARLDHFFGLSASQIQAVSRSRRSRSHRSHRRRMTRLDD
jgi:cereblon